MLEKLLNFDRQFFVYLNSLGSETYDGLWLFITKQTNWTPLFLLLLYFIFKKVGGKQTLILLLFVALLITFTDQVANLFKNGFHRLRPCSELELKSTIRIIKSSDTFSFVSGHATNSMAVATFLFFIFKNHFKYFGFLFLWPLIFAYSRIYLGLHYPLDIIGGYLLGLVSGILMFKIYEITKKKYFPQT